MPSLIVTSGALAGQVFSFSDSAVVGRGQFSDVRMNDTTVSRRHALIRSVGGTYELSDQESVNGTRHRGKRIVTPVLIQDGDEIEFGEVKTLFRIACQRPSVAALAARHFGAYADPTAGACPKAGAAATPGRPWHRACAICSRG